MIIINSGRTDAPEDCQPIITLGTIMGQVVQIFEGLTTEGNIQYNPLINVAITA